MTTEVSRLSLKSAKSRHKQKLQKYTKCRCCGGDYPHKKGKTSCPAFGVECGKCGKLNHYAIYCMSSDDADRSRQSNNTNDKKSTTTDYKRQSKTKFRKHNRKNPVNQVKADGTTDSSSDDGYVFALIGNKERPYVNIKVCDIPLQIMVDTGADVNMLDIATYNKISHLAPLQPMIMEIFPYGTEEDELSLEGEMITTVKSQQKSTTTTFYIASAGNRPLPSYATAKELGLIKITLSAVSKQSQCCISTSQIQEEYADLFIGISK